ncbi:hypothetical protein WA158_000412 [Blastocystis sp. Blastoise]
MLQNKRSLIFLYFILLCVTACVDINGEWPEVNSGEMSIIGCDISSSGIRRRLCLESGDWGEIEDLCIENSNIEIISPFYSQDNMRGGLNPTNTTFRFTTSSSFTISSWFRVRIDNSSTRTTLFSFSNGYTYSNGKFRLLEIWQSGRLHLDAWGTGVDVDGSTINGCNNLGDNIWRFLVLRYDSSLNTLEIKINGNTCISTSNSIQNLSTIDDSYFMSLGSIESNFANPYHIHSILAFSSFTYYRNNALSNDVLEVLKGNQPEDIGIGIRQVYYNNDKNSIHVDIIPQSIPNDETNVIISCIAIAIDNTININIPSIDDILLSSNSIDEFTIGSISTILIPIIDNTKDYHIYCAGKGDSYKTSPLSLEQNSIILHHNYESISESLTKIKTNQVNINNSLFWIPFEDSLEDYSISFYINTIQTSSFFFGFRSALYFNNEGTKDIIIENGKIGLKLYTSSSTSQSFMSIQSINDDIWHHILFCYSSSTNTYTLYIDNNLDSSFINNDSSSYLIAPYFGFYFINGYTQFIGSHKEIRFYHSILNESERLSLYNNIPKEINIQSSYISTENSVSITFSIQKLLTNELIPIYIYIQESILPIPSSSIIINEGQFLSVSSLEENNIIFNNLTNDTIYFVYFFINMIDYYVMTEEEIIEYKLSLTTLSTSQCQQFIATQNCSPSNLIDTTNVYTCSSMIPSTISGYCICKDGRKMNAVTCNHNEFNCNNICESEESFTIINKWIMRHHTSFSSYISVNDIVPILPRQVYFYDSINQAYVSGSAPTNVDTAENSIFTFHSMIYADITGSYSFQYKVDDQVYFLIDSLNINNVVINQNTYLGSWTSVSPKTLTKGWHNAYIINYNGGGAGGIEIQMKGPNDSSFKEITGQYRMSTHGILAQYKTETSTGCTVNYYANTMNTFFTSELMMDLSNENGNTFGTSGNSLTDNFFASYTFILYPTNTNTYTISIEAIDGIKINVDGVTKLTNNVCGEYTGSFDLNLIANTPVMFFIQYRTNGISHKLKLYWKSSDMNEKVLIPSSNIYREDYSRCFQSEVDSLTLPYTYLNNKYEIDCPSGYSGKSYYLCSNPNDKPFAYGIWGSKQSENCEIIPISDVTYQNNTLRLHRYESIRNILSYNGIATSINISPSLPNGLLFNENTGIISGSMSSLLSSTNYIVTVSNSKNSIEIIITIIVEETYCSGDNYPTTATGENAIGSCGDNTLYTGIKSATCGSIYPPIWTNIINTCIRNQCNSITTDSMVFETTNTNSYASITCPNNDGSIIRFCNKDMTWGDIENNCGKIVCIQEEYEGYIWPATEVNTIRSIACGEGLEGNRKRSCNVSSNDSNQGEWSNIIDSSECMIAPVNIDISIPTSSHVMKEIPISFDFYGQNYHIDTNSILLSEGCSIQSTINDISILPQYTILIRRSSECIITFNNGFLLNIENQILTPRSPFSTTLTIAYRPIPVLNESYNNHIGYATELGINKYVVDSRNTENEAIQLLTGGLSYEDKDINTPYSISTSPYSSIGDELSISLWFKIDSIGSKNILTKAGTNSNNYSIFINDNNELIISTGNEMDTCAYYNTNVILNIDTWTHIGFTMKTTSAYSGTKTIYINGESTSCTYSSMYISSQSPVILGETGGITVSDFKLYKYVLTNNEMIELYNTFAIPSIRITVPLTTTSNIIDIPIEFSESVKNININKVSIMNSIGGKDTTMSWTSTTLPSPSIHISFPISSGTRTLTTKLIFDTEFIQSTTTDIYNKYTEYIITYNSIVENPESGSFSPIFNPESSTSMSSNTPITFSFGQEVLFNGNSVIHYFDSEHSDEYNGDILISSLESSLTTLYIILPGGFALGRSIQFSIDSNICTALDGTPCPNVSSENTWIFTTNSPFTGTVVKSIEGNYKYAVLINYQIIYNRPIKHVDDTKIEVTNAAISTIHIMDNILSFALHPMFNSVTNSIDITISIHNSVALDFSIPSAGSSSTYWETFTAYSTVRAYSFKQNGHSDINDKSCLYINNNDNWVSNNLGSITSAYQYSSTTPSWICDNTEDITITKPIIDTSLTISFWYKVLKVQQSFTFIKKSIDSTHIDYQIDYVNGEINIYTYDLSNDNCVTVDSPMDINWHNLVISMKVISETSVDISIYLDGQLSNSQHNIQKSFSTIYNSLNIGDYGSFIMSKVEFIALEMTSELVMNKYLSNSKPILSITYPSIINESFTAIISSSKPITGLSLQSINCIPERSVILSSFNIIDDSHYSIIVSPQQFGIISLYIYENSVKDSDMYSNEQSSLYSFTYGHDIYPQFSLLVSSPCTTPIVPFTISIPFISETININDISSSYGTLSSISVNNNVYSATFKLNDNTDRNQNGIIIWNKNICGVNHNSLCQFEIHFANIFESSIATITAAQEGNTETFSSEYYQQHQFNSGTSNFAISFEANCENDILLGVREYPLSTSSVYPTIVIGGSGNKVLQIRKSHGSSHTNVGSSRTDLSYCVPGTYMKFWWRMQDQIITFGKGDMDNNPLITQNFGETLPYTNMVGIFDNWGTTVYYRNIRIYSISHSFIPSPYIYMDTSSSPYQTIVQFTRNPSTVLSESSILKNNVVLHDFTVVNNNYYTFTVEPIANDNDINAVIAHSIEIPNGAVSFTENENTVVSSSSTFEVYSTHIQVSLTWNSDESIHSYIIPITVSVNIPVIIHKSMFQLPNGGEIVQISQTGYGAIVSIIPPSSSPISVILVENAVEGCISKMITIHNENPSKLQYYQELSDYSYWSDQWISYTNDYLRFTFEAISYDGIRIGFSSTKGMTTGMIELYFGYNNGYTSSLRQYNGNTWNDINIFSHDSMIVSGRLSSYFIIFEKGHLIVGSGNQYNQDTIIIDYEYNLYSPKYFSFASGNSYTLIQSINPYTIEVNLQDILINISSPTSNAYSLPIVFTVVSDINVPLDSWKVSNGYLIEGNEPKSFYLYPFKSSISSLYLPEKVIDTESFHSKATPIYSYSNGGFYQSYILPPSISGLTVAPASNWNLETTNNGNILFTYIPDGSCQSLILLLGSTYDTIDNNNYRINICGISTIEYIYDSTIMDSSTGSSIDCSSSISFTVTITDSSIILLNYDSSITYVSINRNINIKVFSFAPSECIDNNKLTSKGRLENIMIRPLLPSVWYDDMNTVNNFIKDSSSGNKNTWTAEGGVGRIHYTSGFELPTGSRTSVDYYSHTIGTSWKEIIVSVRLSSNSRKNIIACIGIAKTSNINWAADGVCIHNDGGTKYIRHQRKVSGYSDTYVSFTGDFSQFVDLRIVKTSEISYSTYYRVTSTQGSWIKIDDYTNNEYTNLDRLVFYSALKHATKFIFISDDDYSMYYDNVYIYPKESHFENMMGCMSTLDTISNILTSNTLTSDECKNHCLTSHFYGLYQGNKCICINNYLELTGEFIDKKNCDSICTGDSSYFCGGSNSISIYSSSAEYTIVIPFNDDSIWKSDIPNSNLASISYNDGILIQTIHGDTKITSNSRNNAPAVYIPISKPFISIMSVTFESISQQYIAGFAVYNNQNDYFEHLCAIDYSISSEPHLQYKGYNKENSFITINNSFLKIWLKYSRDSEGIFSCQYKLENDNEWSDIYDDTTDTSYYGYRLGIFSSSSIDGKTTSFEDFSISTDTTKPIAILSSELSDTTNDSHHIITASFNKDITLNSMYSPLCDNCDIEQISTLSSSLYEIEIVILSRGTFSIYLPTGFGQDNNKNPSEQSKSIQSQYIVNNFVSWIIPSNNIYINSLKFTIIVVFSIPISQFDGNILEIDNCIYKQTSKIDSNTYEVVFETSKTGLIMISLPSSSVVSTDLVYNLQSNIVFFYFLKQGCESNTIHGYLWPALNSGESYSYNCETGYIGSITRYCLSTGKWSSVEDTCSILMCPNNEYNNDYWLSIPINTISNHECPLYYDGTIYRSCIYNEETNDAQWNIPINACKMIPPYNILYSTSNIVLKQYQEIDPISITYEGIVETIELLDSIPNTIHFNTTDGSFSGFVSDILPLTTYTVRFSNRDSFTDIQITILVEGSYCTGNGYDDTLVATKGRKECGDILYSGYIERECLASYPPVWGTETTECIRNTCSTEIDSVYDILWDRVETDNTVSIDYYDGGIDNCILYRDCELDRTWSSIRKTCNRIKCESIIISNPNDNNESNIELPIKEVNEYYNISCREYYNGISSYKCELKQLIINNTIIKGIGEWSDIDNKMEKNTIIEELYPIYDGIIESYSIEPEDSLLLSGLVFNDANGKISGISNTFGDYNYTIKGINSSGYVSTTMRIRIYNNKCREENWPETIPGHTVSISCDEYYYVGTYDRECLFEETSIFTDPIDNCIKKIPYDTHYSNSYYRYSPSETILLYPSYKGFVDIIRISPELPDSLRFDNKYGIIRGTLPSEYSKTDYTIEFINEIGSNSIIVTIDITNISYGNIWKYYDLNNNDNEIVNNWNQEIINEDDWIEISKNNWNRKSSTNHYYRSKIIISPNNNVIFYINIYSLGNIELYINGNLINVNKINNKVLQDSNNHEININDNEIHILRNSRILRSGINTIALHISLNEEIIDPLLSIEINGYNSNNNMNIGSFSSSRDVYSADEGFSKLIDGTTDTKCLLKGGCANSDLIYTYDNNERYYLTNYYLISGNDCSKRHPSSWRLEGSNDNFISYDILDTVSDNKFTRKYTKKEFTIDTPGAYNSYRFIFTECQGYQAFYGGVCSDSNYLQLSELNIYSNSESFNCMNDDIINNNNDYGNSYDGEISTKNCEDGYSGYIESTCDNSNYINEISHCMINPEYKISYSETNVITTKGIYISIYPITNETIILYEIVDNSLPVGLLLNSSDGTISGNVEETGKHRIIISTMNEIGLISSVEIIIDVMGFCKYDNIDYDTGDSIRKDCSDNRYEGYEIYECKYNGINEWVFISDTCIMRAPIFNYEIDNNTVTLYRKQYASILSRSNEYFIEYFEINPELPSGLIFNRTTGNIFGSPLIYREKTNYTITAYNSDNKSSIIISITILNKICDASEDGKYEESVAGTKIELLCPENELYNGIISRECIDNDNSYWSEIINTCTRNTCNSITEDDVIWDITPTNTTSTKSCDEGLEGSITKKCNLDGTWSNTINTCSIKQCMTDIDSVYNLEWNSIDINTSMSISCSTPYEGVYMRKCNSEGIWESVENHCYVPSVSCIPSQNIFSISRLESMPIYDIPCSKPIQSFTISPLLPNGLSFDTHTAIISGSSTTLLDTTIYTISLSEPYNDSFTISITINELYCESDGMWPKTIAGEESIINCNDPMYYIGNSHRICNNVYPATWGSIIEDSCELRAPYDVSYPQNQISIPINTPMTPLIPTYKGLNVEFSISPSLPSNLIFDIHTGMISGTPTVIIPLSSYTITLRNEGGSIDIIISIVSSSTYCNSIEENGYIFPDTSVGGSVSLKCEDGYSGSIIRNCLSDKLWSPIINTCKQIYCPSKIVNYHELEFSIPETPAGHKSGMHCYEGGIWLSCSISGEWDETIENNCTECNSGQYPVYINPDDGTKVCDTCPSGMICPDGSIETMTGCYGQYWSTSGSKICQLCINGYTNKLLNGNTMCTECKSDEYVYESECIKKTSCSSIIDEDGIWPETLVGYRASLYINNDINIGYITKNCISTINGPQFEQTDYSGLVDKNIQAGHSLIDVNYIFNNLAIYDYDSDAEFLISQSVIRSFAYKLGSIRDYAYSYTFENGIFTVTLHFRFESNYISLTTLEKYIPVSVNSIIDNLHSTNPYLFHNYIYISVPSIIDSKSLNDICEYDDLSSVSLTEYHYESCPSGYTGIISERCLQRHYDSYNTRRQHQCKPINPPFGSDLTYIDITYSVSNTFMQEFTCEIKILLKRYILQTTKQLYYSMDVYNFHEYNNDNLDVKTSFTIRASVPTSYTDTTVDILSSLEDPLKSFFIKNKGIIYSDTTISLEPNSIHIVNANKRRLRSL